MRKKIVKAAAVCLSASLLIIGNTATTHAAPLEAETAVAGISVALNNYYATSFSPEADILAFLKPMVASTKKSVAIETASSDAGVKEETEEDSYKSIYSKVAIAQVEGYVNLRKEPNTQSNDNIIGKIYNNCAANIIDTVEGEDGDWYEVTSGSLTGYIKANLFATGEEAEAIAKKVGVVKAKVIAPELRVRAEASLEAEVLTQLALDSEYKVLEDEKDGFVKIDVGSGIIGYVYAECVELSVDFEEAISLEEEAAQLAEIEQVQKDANYAIKVYNESIAAGKYENAGSAIEYCAELQDTVISLANEIHRSDLVDAAKAQKEEALNLASEAYAKVTDESTSTEYSTTQAATQAPTQAQTQAPTQAATQAPTQAATPPATNSSVRSQIVNEAISWVGRCNYNYGSNNLTVGGAVDCSAFTSSIYSHYGISIPRTSYNQASAGRSISFDQLQPGDLVFYSSGAGINHVAIYIGNGQIVHAANPAVGIIISSLNYKAPVAAATYIN